MKAISKQKKSKSSIKKNVCLVLPEGYESETKKLLDFIIQFSKKNKDIKFIFRLHPILNFNEIKKIKPEYNKLPHNIIFSEQKLDFDIKRSSFVLYRGTTAVIQAVSQGLCPIYLASDDEMNIDPLYSVLNKKNNINNEDDLKLIIKKYNKNRKLGVKLMRFCKLFYKDLNYKVLKKYIY